MKMKHTLSMVLLALASVFRLGARESCHNIASTVGTHSTGAIPLECQTAAITTRYLLVQKGTSDTQFIVNVATTRPWGVIADEPAVGDTGTVLLLGCTPGTMKMVANAAITVGSPVYTAAAGKVSPTFGSTLYMVGRALTPAAADGDLIEVAHCFPLLNSASL
jgi:hypothetical protein